MHIIDYIGYCSNSQRTFSISPGMHWLKNNRVYAHDGKEISAPKSFLFFDLLTNRIYSVSGSEITKYHSKKSASYKGVIVLKYNKKNKIWEIGNGTVAWHVFSNLTLSECNQKYELHVVAMNYDKDDIIRYGTLVRHGNLSPFTLFCDFNRSTFAIDPPGNYDIKVSLNGNYTVKKRIMTENEWSSVEDSLISLKVGEHEEFLIAFDQDCNAGGIIEITMS